MYTADQSNNLGAIQQQAATMGMGCVIGAGQSAHKPEIQAEVDVIQGRLEELEKTATSLLSRFDLVLRPEELKNQTDQIATVNQPKTKLGIELREVGIRLKSLICRLQELGDRSEV